MQNNEMEELRSEIKAKGVALLAEKVAHSRAEVERQSLLAEVARVQRGIADSNQESAAAQKEIDSMQTAMSLAGKVCPALMPPNLPLQ